MSSLFRVWVSKGSYTDCMNIYEYSLIRDRVGDVFFGSKKAKLRDVRKCLDVDRKVLKLVGNQTRENVRSCNDE